MIIIHRKNDSKTRTLTEFRYEHSKRTEDADTVKNGHVLNWSARSPCRSGSVCSPWHQGGVSTDSGPSLFNDYYWTRNVIVK